MFVAIEWNSTYRKIKLCVMNAGWFGIRKEFCPWVLDACPVLQEYGNISYKVKGSPNVSRATREEDGLPTESNGGSRETTAGHKRSGGNARSKRHGTLAGCDEQPRCVIPIVSIDMPD